MDWNPVGALFCSCGRSFTQPGSLNFHQKSCKHNKKRAIGALEKAKELWTERKRRCAPEDLMEGHDKTSQEGLNIITNEVCCLSWKAVHTKAKFPFDFQIEPTFHPAVQNGTENRVALTTTLLEVRSHVTSDHELLKSVRHDLGHNPAFRRRSYVLSGAESSQKTPVSKAVHGFCTTTTTTPSSYVRILFPSFNSHRSPSIDITIFEPTTGTSVACAADILHPS